MECGCFCCLQAFAASEVIDRIDDGDTPLCLHCGIAVVLPSVEPFRLRERRFAVPALVKLPEEV